MTAPLHVLVIGWHGSRERHLRPIVRLWDTLGARATPIVPDTWRAMSRAGGWQRAGRLLCDQHLGGEPWIAHAFSNAGFWTLCGILEAAEARGALALHRGTVLDSAPGFPERISPLFTAKYASMAMTPSVLAALGRAPRDVHPLVTPPLAAFLALWHLVAPEQIGFMETSQARFIARHARRPLLAIYGGADRLVRPRHVEAFLARAEAGGVAVERLFFPGSAHVRHFVDHRHEVTDRITTWLAAAQPGR